MKVTKKMAAVAAGASLLAMAGVAGAQVIEVNIFGASAQFDFWNNASQQFLDGTGAGNPQCTILTTKTTTNVAAPSPGFGNKYGTAYGQNCQNPLPGTNMAVGDDILIRYASKASWDGINAMTGNANASDTNGTVAPYNKACQDASNGSLPANYRWFGDETSVVGGQITALVCKPVTVGASDVEAAAFVQSSRGLKLGPADPGGVHTYSVAPVVNPGTLISKTPIMVPFGFFVNKCVMNNKCTGDANFNGKLCYQDADCGTGTCRATSDGNAPNGANENTIDGITREQAVAIFSGAATNWANFGDYFASQPIVACLRHAGSGTHATLDQEVMHSTWGGGTVTREKLPTAAFGAAPYTPAINPAAKNTSTANAVFFNDATGDELNCIGGKSNAAAWTGATTQASSCIGAIGYADGDKACSSLGNVVAIKYNGNLPSREAIRNGRYEFFGNENMYFFPTTNGANQATDNNAGVATALDTYAGSVAGMADALSTNACRATYWATRSEMGFGRASTNAWVQKGAASQKVEP